MSDSLKQLEILRSKLSKVFSSPDQLADLIGEIFEVPITIEDSSHHIVSYSKHMKVIDEARMSTIMNRKVPDKVINGLWKNGVMSKLIDSDKPVIISRIDEIGLGNRVAISIRDRNKILGFIWVHTGDKTLSEEELRLLTEVAAQVKKFFLKQSKTNTQTREQYNDFFWQLLTGDMDDTKEIYRQAKQFSVELEGMLAIIVIRFTDDITEQLEKHAHYLTKHQLQVQVISHLFDGYDFIMLVRHYKKDDPAKLITDFINQFIDRISTQLQLTSVNGASGLVYKTASNIKDSYKQALKVLELKGNFPNELRETFLYEDLGVYQFIDELYEIRKSNHYQNKYIEKLRAYDKKHQTSLIRTLKMYLHCDCNVYQAAKKLIIHPNTMNYRIKRIREVSGIDLKDPNQKTTIYLDFIIERMQEG
ncbi:PucR family transcriptional regulator [Oceanobacillus damuensis]|uniref:PucR family transcriptional regulator n=1 Tax=Oceanobacillus damuensis TaxID=937928 RepID=UPI00083441FE|nr:helix-turn-helix domain-containing protein [Oceanobacillus damuensis]